MSTKLTRRIATAAIAGFAALACTTGAMAADITLKASHQWPGGKGDARDEMVQMIAKEVEKANVGLNIQVYPGASLFKPKEQWGAMTKGQLDISAFPLDYASGRVPQFSATLMPGLVQQPRPRPTPQLIALHGRHQEDHRGQRRRRPVGCLAGRRLRLEEELHHLARYHQGPGDARGRPGVRGNAGGRRCLDLLDAVVADLYRLQTGVLDATNTSSGSFVSYRIYEQVKCLTAPGANALWFMYEPILMSKMSFDKLDKAQQDALMAAGKKAEVYFNGEARKLDDKMISKFKEAGVEVVEMSQDDYDAWLAIAKETAYKNFSEKVDGGAKLIDEALAVQ